MGKLTKNRTEPQNRKLGREPTTITSRLHRPLVRFLKTYHIGLVIMSILDKMTPKHVKRAEEVWNERAQYFDRLFSGNARVHEETDGEDFRHQHVATGDPILISSGYGEMRSGYIWRIMGFGKGCRNYFVFVPVLGRVLVRASAYIARDTSE